MAIPDRPVNKGDIINRLITQFNFSSYLEYNKFDGATYFDEIRCASKTAAYLPEDSYLDGPNIQRLLKLASSVDFDQILSLEGLLTRYAGRQFDLIFFDPVHIRPGVDLTLQTLARLLSPGGVLVIHDCNPTDPVLTSVRRRPGSWVGETYKAFALFRHFNRTQTLTIDEDFGVGLIWNVGLTLDYPTAFDLDYADFDQDRAEYIGLTDYASFLARTAAGDAAALFRQAPRRRPIALKASAGTATTAVPPRQPAATAEAQLFWRAADLPYTGATTLTQGYRCAADPVQLNWTLPPGAARLHEIRLDISDRALCVRLDSMRVRAPDDAVAWEWRQEPAVLESPKQMRLFFAAEHRRTIYLQSTGDDPRCLLALPEPVMVRLGAGWQLQIGLTPLPPLFDALLTEMLRGQEYGAGDACMLSTSQGVLIEQAMALQQQHRQLEQRLARLDAMLLQWRSQPD